MVKGSVKAVKPEAISAAISDEPVAETPKPEEPQPVEPESVDHQSAADELLENFFNKKEDDNETDNEDQS
jgi:hypothetical protein